MLRSKNRRTAYIFDLDNTLIKGNCSFKYFAYLNKKKIFSYRSWLSVMKYLIRYTYFHLSPFDLHKEVFLHFLKGRLFDEIFVFVEEFLDRYLQELINPEVLFFLREAQRKKHLTIILSNSPHYLAEPIAKRLNVKESLGSTYNLDAEGRFVSIANIMDGKAKARYTASLGENIEEKIVFTDSIWDRPLLDIADKCYLVNPDRKLTILAKKKGWFFL